MYGTGIKEATDGKYYVAENGVCVHVDPDCQYLYYSMLPWRDATNTISTRIAQGRKLCGPNGRRITSHCWYCTIDHEERHVMALKQRIRIGRAVDKVIASRTEHLLLVSA